MIGKEQTGLLDEHVDEAIQILGREYNNNVNYELKMNVFKGAKLQQFLHKCKKMAKKSPFSV